MTVQQRWAAVPNAHDGREAYLNHTVRLALFHTEVVEQPCPGTRNRREERWVVVSRLGRDSKATGRQTFFRGPGGNRTHDLRIKSPLLYRLSYRPAAERVVAHRPPSSLFWRPIVPDPAVVSSGVRDGVTFLR